MNMKNLMNIRGWPLLMLLIAIGLFGTSAVWWVRAPKQNASKTANERPKQMPETSPDPAAQQGAEGKAFVFEKTLGFKEAETLYPNVDPRISVFHSMFTDEDREAMDDQAKRAYQIVASQEFIDFMAGKPTTEESDRWWAARGFFYDPDRFKKAFREHFPTGEPEDYEPEMREKYAALFEGITAENETEMVFANAHKFIQDSQNQAWIKGYFNREGIDRDETLTAWTSSIRRDLIYGSEIDGTDTGNVLSPGVSQADELQEFLESSEGAPQTPNLQSNAKGTEPSHAPQMPETGDTSPDPPEVVNIHSLEALELPELPTDASLESALRQHFNSERFSPQRLNAAMQTLNQYGPTEGLRRLKSSDPEVATRLERVLQPQKEND